MTPCCCRPPVPASTCFATTRSAAARSRPPCRSSPRRCVPASRRVDNERARQGPAHRRGGAVAGRGHRAARPDHGDVGFDLDRQQGIGRCVFLPRAPARVVPDRLRAGGAGVLRAHRIPGEIGLAAADHRGGTAVLRAHPGSRSRRERQPPLDPRDGIQFPGVRAGASADAHLHRQLRRAARGRTAQYRARAHQAHGAAGLRRAAAARRARFRRRLGVVDLRLRHPVRRRGPRCVT